MKNIFTLLLFITLFQIKGSAQEGHKVVLGRNFLSVSLREYDLDMINKNQEPKYVKTAKDKDQLFLIDIIKDFAIVVFENDTFCIGKRYLEPDFLRRFLKIDYKFYEEGMPNIELTKITPEQASINQISKLELLLNKEVGVKTKFLHSDDFVQMIGYNKDTAYVFYDSILYYTDIKSLISPTAQQVLEDIKQAKIREEERIKDAKLLEEKKAKEARIMAAQKRKKDLIDKYGEEIANTILKQEIYIGMTKDMVIESWGKPDKINTTTTAYSQYEQWVYGNRSYLYFENGILTTAQN